MTGSLYVCLGLFYRSIYFDSYLIAILVFCHLLLVRADSTASCLTHSRFLTLIVSLYFHLNEIMGFSLGVATFSASCRSTIQKRII